MTTRSRSGQDFAKAQAGEMSDSEAATTPLILDVIQEALQQVKILDATAAAELAQLFVDNCLDDLEMVASVTEADVQKILPQYPPYAKTYPDLLPKNIVMKMKKAAKQPGVTSPAGSPKAHRSESQLQSQHTTTAAAVAIDAAKSTTRLAKDEDTKRPSLDKTHDFLQDAFSPYGPYDQSLMPYLKEMKADLDFDKEAAAEVGRYTDPLVARAMLSSLRKNMGTGTYDTYVKPHLTKQERECPILVAWQILSEARKVSEVDLSKRYTAVLEPARASTVAQLAAVHQQHVDETAELRLHGFVPDAKAPHLKEALLKMVTNFPVLITKIELEWQKHKQDPAVALQSVHKEIAGYTTMHAGDADRGHMPVAGGKHPLGALQPTKQHPADIQICRQFRRSGTCTYGDKCKFKHERPTQPGVVMMVDPVIEQRVEQLQEWMHAIPPDVFSEGSCGQAEFQHCYLRACDDLHDEDFDDTMVDTNLCLTALTAQHQEQFNP